MSHGRTGFIMRVWAELCWFGWGVQVMYSETYELHDRMTSIDTVSCTYYFPTRFRARLYARRIDDGQFHRYVGTEWATGFTS